VSTNSDAYFDTLALARPPGRIAAPRTTSAQPKDLTREARQAALTRAHQIRQFEIELYWKRANYFWLLQAAVFAAVGLTWKNVATGVPAAVPVLLSALGVVTAWAGCLSALGSKFWQENWEHHIDMLEDEFEGKLHKTAYVGARGVQWSVSGINERLNYCFVAFWLLILLAATHTANPDWNLRGDFQFSAMSLTEAATAGSWLAAATGMVVLYWRPTSLAGKLVNYPDAAASTPVQKGLPRLWKWRAHSPFLAQREPKT
jgi:hypothetical protein